MKLSELWRLPVNEVSNGDIALVESAIYQSPYDRVITPEASFVLNAENLAPSDDSFFSDFTHDLNDGIEDWTSFVEGLRLHCRYNL